MIIIRYTVILLILASIYCCSSSDPVIKRHKFVIGDFNYQMTDSAGNVLVNGVMKVDFLKEGKLSGSYTALKNADHTFEGSSTMKDGGFSGMYTDSSAQVFFNMNPRMADANVFIYAKDYTDSLSGYWSYSVLRGNKTGGFYSAKRIK